MPSSYNPQEIEPKWQERWERERAFATPELAEGDAKAYILNMFPYPSGSGLHVGHLLGYTGTDILARYSRMRGKKVLHPMGWDAFGLPAENFAIKSGVHPSVSTERNVREYKRQFRQTGISYDWEREINTSLPEYYKWTQWFFLIMHERGLAYRKRGLVNWCPSCQTVLANEQVVGGRCERCDSLVVQRELEQWYFRITQYAQRLLDDLDKLDWPERIKLMQRNWIGRSEGAQLFFPVQGRDEQIEVFTTRPDTLFGATYMVLAPEHRLVGLLTTPGQQEAVERYRRQAAEKSELERLHLEKEKTGAFTGSYAVNPATGLPIPIWIADYVVSTYGTGAIMAVPAHDERDYAFALKYGLPVVQVIEGEGLPYLGSGRLENSGEFDGQENVAAVEGILAKVGGRRQVTYRLRDWLVSRQRFWGAPIPVAYDKEGNEHVLPADQLPILLPENAEFLPTGQSPLSRDEEWKRYRDPASGQELVREVDTLDGFVCSSWYYLRYPTPHLAEAAFDRGTVDQWLPVDMYVGGAEHAVLHLLYARFLTKVLFDAGYIGFDEPFLSLRNQGSILGPDHNKMSKSKGNVINPDAVIAEYGADTLRTYEMFMGPFDQEKPWSTAGISGVRRFLDRVWKLAEAVTEQPAGEEEQLVLHRLTKKVGEDIEAFKFNTAVSAMMEALNRLDDLPGLSADGYGRFLHLLSPFAPHITEELWNRLGNQGLCSLSPWPSYDESFLREESVEYPVQVDGRVRSRLRVPADLPQEELLRLAREDAKVAPFLAGRQLTRQIVVPGRLVSLATDEQLNGGA